MRLSDEFLRRLDEWRQNQPDLPSRAESIRRLTTAMLQILDKDPGKKASKPNKLKLMALGILAGLGLGLLAPLVYELLFHRRVRCADDIERQFGIPILAKLGALPALTGAR